MKIIKSRRVLTDPKGYIETDVLPLSVTCRRCRSVLEVDREEDLTARHVRNLWRLFCRCPVCRAHVELIHLDVEPEVYDYFEHKRSRIARLWFNHMFGLGLLLTFVVIYGGAALIAWLSN